MPYKRLTLSRLDIVYPHTFPDFLSIEVFNTTGRLHNYPERPFAIEARAAEVAGADKITNQLEVNSK